jgi:hypothetical protein
MEAGEVAFCQRFDGKTVNLRGNDRSEACKDFIGSESRRYNGFYLQRCRVRSMSAFS